MANLEKLKDAYAILDGIPTHKLNLNEVLGSFSGDLSCGTIACGAGWLSLHPTFLSDTRVSAEMGQFRCGERLQWKIRHAALTNSRVLTTTGYSLAMALVFDIDYDDANRLFAPAECRDQLYNHKAILLARLHAYIKHHEAKQ
jgi:hypothetical protein